MLASLERDVASSSTSAPSYSGDGMATIYEFVVEVNTGSGEVFRAKAGEPHIAMDFMDSFGRPDRGRSSTTRNSTTSGSRRTTRSY